MRKLTAVLAGLLFAVVARAEVIVPAWLTGAETDSPAHLTRDQLEAWVDGQPAAVLDVRQPGGPLVLLLVMDTVSNLNRVDAARGALRERLQSMPPDWRVGLLRAQDGLEVVADPTNDVPGLINELDSVAVTGLPDLLDAVLPVASIADSMIHSARVRVAVLFVTDGSIESYRGNLTSTVINRSDNRDLSRRFNDRIIQERITSMARALQQYSAPLFFVHLEERSRQEERAYQDGIQEFARVSGGEAFFVRSLSDVAPTIDQALDRIAGQYAVRVATPDGATGVVDVRLELHSGTLQLDHRASVPVSE